MDTTNISRYDTDHLPLYNGQARHLNGAAFFLYEMIEANYCILYAKQYIYLEKLNDNKNKQNFKVDFWSYLSHLINTLKIEKKYMY